MKPKNKYPAYGKALVDRLAFCNPPRLIIVEVGGDAWQRAKEWNLKPDIAALVLTPEQPPKALHWPVRGCQVIVEWGLSAPKQLIIELVGCLLRAGADSVTVFPLFVDFNKPAGFYDNSQNPPVFVQERYEVKTYRAEVSHV
jgi:hypothetical protein